MPQVPIPIRAPIPIGVAPVQAPYSFYNYLVKYNPNDPMLSLGTTSTDIYKALHQVESGMHGNRVTELGKPYKIFFQSTDNTLQPPFALQFPPMYAVSICIK